MDSALFCPCPVLTLIFLSLNYHVRFIFGTKPDAKPPNTFNVTTKVEVETAIADLQKEWGPHVDFSKDRIHQHHQMVASKQADIAKRELAIQGHK